MIIGNTKLTSNKILAPMAEITDYSFRTIAKKFGCGLTYTQMVSAEGIIKNNFDTLRMCAFSRAEKPIGVQLLGKDPAIVGRAVKELVRFKPDVIDLNCGCPVDKVYGKKMGAYILSQPDNLGKLVKEMVKNSEGIPISVKVRLGHKKKINVIENAKIIEDNGASIITIHARSRSDRYSIDPNWDWIAKVKDTVKIKVIGNGSIFNATDAEEMVNKTSCDGVLIARGALGNPFIFKDKNYLPELDEIYTTALEHTELLQKEQDVRIHLDRAKKNIIWYFKYLNGIENLISELYSATCFEKLKEIIYNHKNRLLENYYPQSDTEDIRKQFNNKVLFWLAKKEDKIIE